MKRITKRSVIFTLVGVALLGLVVMAFALRQPKEQFQTARDYQEGKAFSQAYPSEAKTAYSETGASAAGSPENVAATSQLTDQTQRNSAVYESDFTGIGSDLKVLSMPLMDDKIIRTANLELQVRKGKFDNSYDRAVAIARSVGGYVSQSKSQSTGDSIASGEILMRVPSRDFEMVLASLKRIGKVKAIDISSEDVSEEYVDLESRLKHWRAQETVLLDLMGKTRTIAESIQVQNSLSQIQMGIERISGRLKFLENRVTYATIHLYIAEPQVVARADKWGLNSALNKAMMAGARVMGSFIILLGYLVPLSLLIGIGYVLYRSIRRLARNRLLEDGQ